MRPPPAAAAFLALVTLLPLAHALVAPSVFPMALPAAVPSAASIRIDADAPGEPFPRALLGQAMNPATEAVAAEIRAAGGVPTMRVPMYLETAAPAPGEFRWGEIDARFGLIRAAGATPVGVLAFTPRWLSGCIDESDLHAGGPFCPPTDLAAWRAIVRAAVAYAATRWGARDFEVWNEPDHPGFWLGTPAEYLLLYEAGALGVLDAARDTGLPLRVGGPAAAFPNVPLLAATLGWASLKGLPLDFVSFHWYADYPLFGPVGPAPGTVATESPALLARAYGDFAQAVRTLADAMGHSRAEVWIDEWNVNAGDSERMKGAFGAAFVAATVREMQRARLDQANFFGTQLDPWGLFSASGEMRPSWKAMRALLTLGDVALPVGEDGSPFAGAVAVRAPGGGVRALVYNFNPQADVAVDARVRVEGLGEARVTVRDLDGALLQAGDLPPGGFALHLPNLAVRVVEITSRGL